jgi:hypothetical protein
MTLSHSLLAAQKGIHIARMHMSIKGHRSCPFLFIHHYGERRRSLAIATCQPCLNYQQSHEVYAAVPVIQSLLPLKFAMASSDKTLSVANASGVSQYCCKDLRSRFHLLCRFVVLLFDVFFVGHIRLLAAFLVGCRWGILLNRSENSWIDQKHVRP